MHHLPTDAVVMQNYPAIANHIDISSGTPPDAIIILPAPRVNHITPRGSIIVEYCTVITDGENI